MCACLLYPDFLYTHIYIYIFASISEIASLEEYQAKSRPSLQLRLSHNLYEYGIACMFTITKSKYIFIIQSQISIDIKVQRAKRSLILICTQIYILAPPNTDYINREIRPFRYHWRSLGAPVRYRTGSNLMSRLQFPCIGPSKQRRLFRYPGMTPRRHRRSYDGYLECG